MTEMTRGEILIALSVSNEVTAERQEQHSKWGEQNHDNGTGGAMSESMAVALKKRTDSKTKKGTLTWMDILAEEIAEAFAETDPDKLRTELVQVAAVAVAWVECIDRGKQ